MADFRGYEKVYNKTNIGLGLGGNPTDSTLQSDRLTDSKDISGVTINPPQPQQPKQLTTKDFLEIMNDGGK